MYYYLKTVKTFQADEVAGNYYYNIKILHIEITLIATGDDFAQVSINK